MGNGIKMSLSFTILAFAFAGLVSMSVPTLSLAHGMAEKHAREGMAEKHAREATTTNDGTKKMRAGKVDATCMQTAVATREGALISAWEGFSADITTALTARKTALNDAWGKTDATSQREALVKSWQDWKKASKDAHMELQKDRKAAWETFKKTTKESCKITAPKDEALEKDAAGTIAL